MTAFTGRITVNLPNGSEATFEEMQSYGRTLQAFIRAQEVALPQVTDTRRHNQIIDYLRLLADGYNAQLRVFRAAQAQREKAILMVAVIQIVDA